MAKFVNRKNALERSNNSHNSLTMVHYGKAINSRDGSKKQFYSMVKSLYHQSVRINQIKLCYILPTDVKKKIYKGYVNDYARSEKERIAETGKNRYLPKKYR